MIPPAIKTVGVLCGGRSLERPGSLQSGSAVIESLRRQHYNVLPIDPKEEHSLIHALAKVDCAFIALHGTYGEDGKIQGLLEILNIPYTGSGVTASAICMNKPLFKKLLVAEDIPTPAFVAVDNEHLAQSAEKAASLLGFPLIVKPIAQGGSLGISIVHSLDGLVGTLQKTIRNFGDVFVEAFVKGDFMTIGLLGRYQRPQPLPLMRVTFNGDLYDYDIKHTHGAAKYIVPADVPHDIYRSAERHAMRIYASLGCHGPLRVDFMLSDDGTPYVIESNTVPGMSTIGNLPTIAAAAGLCYDKLVTEILNSAFNRPQSMP